jgi:cytochrome c-type biogenesis protein CcmH/NrfG
MDHVQRANYDDHIDSRRDELRGSWAFELGNAQSAADAYQRGQHHLVSGEVFKAVSAFASACRTHPDHPDYECSLTWAQYSAELARGTDDPELARRHRAAASDALAGRRPWPRALVALAMLCSADGDAAAARYCLREALSVNPNLPAAKQLLGRLGRGGNQRPDSY